MLRINLGLVKKFKNSSIISKNSSYSDKRYESTKVDDKDSAIRNPLSPLKYIDDKYKFSSARKSIQVHPKFSEEKDIGKKSKLYKHLKTSTRNANKNSRK